MKTLGCLTGYGGVEREGLQAGELFAARLLHTVAEDVLPGVQLQQLDAPQQLIGLLQTLAGILLAAPPGTEITWSPVRSSNTVKLDDTFAALGSYHTGQVLCCFQLTFVFSKVLDFDPDGSTVNKCFKINSISKFLFLSLSWLLKIKADSHFCGQSWWLACNRWLRLQLDSNGTLAEPELYTCFDSPECSSVFGTVWWPQNTGPALTQQWRWLQSRHWFPGGSRAGSLPQWSEDGEAERRRSGWSGGGTGTFWCCVCFHVDKMSSSWTYCIWKPPVVDPTSVSEQCEQWTRIKEREYWFFKKQPCPSSTEVSLYSTCPLFLCSHI